MTVAENTTEAFFEGSEPKPIPFWELTLTSTLLGLQLKGSSGLNESHHFATVSAMEKLENSDSASEASETASASRESASKPLPSFWEDRVRFKQRSNTSQKGRGLK